MEVTRTPPVPGTAQTPRGAPSSPPRAQAPAAKAEARQIFNEALAKAILADGNIEPTDFKKFNVRLDIDKETGRVVAQIENRKTGELLQKIPSETILRNAAMLDRVIGTILDTPA